MSPASILRMLRMSLCVRLLSKGHFDILSALYLAREHERSYLSAVKADLKFLTDLGGVFEEFRGKTIAEWTVYISSHPRHFLTQSCELLGSEGAILRDTPPSKNSLPNTKTPLMHVKFVPNLLKLINCSSSMLLGCIKRCTLYIWPYVIHIVPYVSHNFIHVIDF